MPRLISNPFKPNGIFHSNQLDQSIKIEVSMIRKYHNHKPQTTPWHREEEPHNNHKTPGRQTKQSDELSLPHQDRERSGSVVECLTRDRGAAGSSLTGVTALWFLSKTHLS